MATDDEAGLSRVLGPDFSAHHHSLDRLLPELLRAIRSHLEMDVAFVSEFSDGQRVFRYVDSPLQGQPVKVGGADPLEASYCQRVVDGRLPELIQDATALPAALELPVTLKLPVGAHLSVPIRLSDGTVFGTFCCFSFKADHSLNQRDLGMMRVFADLASDAIERDLETGRQDAEKAKRIRSVLEGSGLSMVYQPIVDVEYKRIIGYECLTRFTAIPSRTPDAWFNEAESVGMGTQLEMKALELGVSALDRLPESLYLSVNVSPEAAISGDLRHVLEGRRLDRIVLEITEHATVTQYPDLLDALAPLRAHGLRLAVDDAGAGYSSFRHILRLLPDIIKLDMSLTRDIDSDSARRALALALIGFGKETGCEIVAEGVQTASELDTLRSLGVTKAQGYFLGRPEALPVVSLSVQPRA